MITCPAIVPTDDEESPEASNEIAKTQDARGTQQGHQCQMRLFDRANGGQSVIEKGSGGHNKHRGIDGAGNSHGDKTSTNSK